MYHQPPKLRRYRLVTSAAQIECIWYGSLILKQSGSRVFRNGLEIQKKKKKKKKEQTRVTFYKDGNFAWCARTSDPCDRLILFLKS